ncbi:MAG: hypothetical protein ACW98D_03625 [Promethearchaeota archaeon]|jgi:hypothetical protein
MVSFFTELYELFEKDFVSDLLALTNTAKRISGNNDILINFNQRSHIAFTDGRFIYLPTNIKSDIKSSQGLVAHESGHIGYGSYELSFIKLAKTISAKYSFPEFIVRKIINVVEDVRINALNNIKFPGFYKNLRSLTKKLLPELKLRMKKSGDILIYLNLYMEDYKDFQKKPQFRTRLMSDKDWNAISVAKTFLLKTLTPASSIITIDQLSKVLKKYYIKRTINKNPPPSTRSPSPPGLAKEYFSGDDAFDVVEGIIDGEEFTSNNDPDGNFDVSDSADFIEDPCYYDEFENQSYQDYNHTRDEPILNHYEDFTNKWKKSKDSELDITSEKIIDTIKDSDLSTNDLEKLIKEIDSFEDKINGKSIYEIQNDSTNTEINDIEDIGQKLNPEGKVTGEFDQNDLKELGKLLTSNFDKENISIEEIEKGNYLGEFIKIVTDAQNAMGERLVTLDEGINFIKFSEGKGERKVVEARIENERMQSIEFAYNQIIKEYKNLIARIKFIFKDFKNQIDIDSFQKRGRLNSKFIKAVTSDYKYNKCFSRKKKQKELKILLLVDISGSMKGIKLECAKIAMIMLCEALKEIAQLRIVLFTGDYDAINILLKDFNDQPDPKKFDKFGCHGKVNSNLDGISLKHEAAKLEKSVLIIVISDGQPAGSGNYGMNDAIKEIHDVKKLFKVFAFSIDAKGDYLDKLYDKNWILTHSSDKIDLGDKLIKFCRLVVKEFFR